MTNKQPKLIPYEHTLYDILINDIKGKYFQNLTAPHLLFQIPEENQLGIHYVENGKLSVWFPLLERHGDVSLNDFHEYVLISEEQFKEYQKNPGDVFDYLLAHKESEIFKKNKANLSAKKTFGITVDKSKATRTVNMRITPFSKNSRLNH